MHITRHSFSMIIGAALMTVGCSGPLIKIDQTAVETTTGSPPATTTATQTSASSAQTPTPLTTVPTIALATDPFANPALSMLDDTQLTALAISSNSIWDRIRTGFQIEDEDNERIQAELNFYRRYPDYLQRVVGRSEPFMHLILEEIEKRNLPTELALLPIVESAFQVFAYSHGRAAGIWQFIPSTGKLFGLKQNWWYDGRRDVYASTQAALDLFIRLSERFDGDWLHALAAYNSGDGTVMRAMRANEKHHKPTDFWALNLPAETRAYVPKLLAIKAIFKNPEAYGLVLPEIPNEQQVATVDTGGQIDLALAAELAGLSIDEMYQYNPGFNRWATDPEGPHRLLLPIEQIDAFEQALAKIPADQRVTWHRYQVKSGQTLSEIARINHTTVEQLKASNDIRGNNIRAGAYLLVPQASKNVQTYTLSANQRQAKLQAASGDGQKLTHTVNAGDTLWSLSRRYGVSPKHLAKWNGLAVRDVIRPGQKLVLWIKSGNNTKTTAFIPSAAAGLSNRDAIRNVKYTIRKGDSLSSIASRFSVSVHDLKRWNPHLQNQKYLKPGEKVTLYVDVRQQAG